MQPQRNHLISKHLAMFKGRLRRQIFFPRASSKRMDESSQLISPCPGIFFLLIFSHKFAYKKNAILFTTLQRLLVLAKFFIAGAFERENGRVELQGFIALEVFRICTDGQGENRLI